MYGLAVLAEHRVLLGGRRLRTMVRTTGSSHRARPGVSPRWPDSARRSPLRAGIFDRRSGRVSITTNVALLLARRCGWVKHRTLGRSRRSPTGGGDPAVQHVRPTRWDTRRGTTTDQETAPGRGAGPVRVGRIRRSGMVLGPGGSPSTRPDPVSGEPAEPSPPPLPRPEPRLPLPRGGGAGLTPGAQEPRVVLLSARATTA